MPKLPHYAIAARVPLANTTDLHDMQAQTAGGMTLSLRIP
jgi:hypothetical protein